MKSIKYYLPLFILTAAVSCDSSRYYAIDSDGGDGNTSEESDAFERADAAVSAVVVNPVASGWTGECEKFEEQTDYTWDSKSEVGITLSDDGITATDTDVTIEGKKVTITSAGNYRLSGRMTDGSILVNAGDDDLIRLILDNLHLASLQDCPLYLANGKRAVIILADGSTNSVTDGSIYSDVSNANAALYSKINLTISGSGSLTVNGNYQDGITSKDGLIINGGTLVVNAVDDGVRGKDCLIVKDGNLSVKSAGDGLKSDNENDANLGYIALKAGTFDVEATGDAIAANTTVYVTQGTFNLTSGGGSEQVITDDLSAKGIKGTAGLVIDDGQFTVDSSDDAIHTDGVIYLNGGSFTLASGDDAIHSDGSIEIGGPTINITKSYEGIEGVTITVNDGNIHIASSDDGINASDGSFAAAAMPGAPGVGNAPPGSIQGDFSFPGATVDGMAVETRPGASDPISSQASAMNDDLLVTINGGNLVIDAYGDALDSNGSMKMTGGTVLASGPIDNMNGAIDMGDCSGCRLEITGGFLVAAGSTGMAEAPDARSLQNSVFITTESIGMGPRNNFQPGAASTGLAGGTLVHIENTAGESLLTYAPEKQYGSLVFSSPKLVNGSYTVYTGGTCTGVVTNNLCEGGTYENGTLKTTFTIDNSSTVATARWTL